MVKGFELFKERFSEFGESFIVIGGTACDLNLSRFGGFRRTKDIDIMVLTENVSDDFASALHGFFARRRIFVLCFTRFKAALLPLSFSGKRFISMADRNAVAFVAAGASGCAIYTDIS